MRLRSLLLVSPIALACCGGPNMQYDPTPAPVWLGAETTVKGAKLVSVGSAPVTTNPQRDRNLAENDAKMRIGQLFDSQVASRSSDWTLIVASKAGSHERSVTQQSVEVRSNVQVEDAQVQGAYRDENTKMQYVQVAVDRAAWAHQLHERVGTQLTELTASAASAQAELQQRHVFAAYKAVLNGRAAGQRVEPDIIVLDLLDPQAGAYPKLVAARDALAKVQSQVVGDFGLSVQVANAPTPIAEALRAGLQDFLKEQGFAASDGHNAARVVVNVGAQFVQVANVANRREQVQRAVGVLKVYEPDGREVPELAVSLGSNETESDVDAGRAHDKAMQLAADALVAKFRSAFRKDFIEGVGK